MARALTLRSSLARTGVLAPGEVVSLAGAIRALVDTRAALARASDREFADSVNIFLSGAPGGQPWVDRHLRKNARCSDRAARRVRLADQVYQLALRAAAEHQLRPDVNTTPHWPAGRDPREPALRGTPEEAA